MSPVAVSRLVQRILAAGYLGIPSSRVRIVRRCPRHGLGDHGRPELTAPGGPDYSIAHTTGLLAMAVTGQGRVGIDVERANRPMDVRTAVHPFLTPMEIDQIGRLPEPAARARLLTLWTRKEAVGKVTGHGLSRALRGVEVSEAVAAPLVVQSGGEVWLHTLRLPDAYVGALATTRPVTRISVRTAASWLCRHWPLS